MQKIKNNREKVHGKTWEAGKQVDEGLTVLVEPKKLKFKQAVGKLKKQMIYTKRFKIWCTFSPGKWGWGGEWCEGMHKDRVIVLLGRDSSTDSMQNTGNLQTSLFIVRVVIKDLLTGEHQILLRAELLAQIQAGDKNNIVLYKKVGIK